MEMVSAISSATPPPERMTYIFLGSNNPDTLPAYTWEGFWAGGDNIMPDLNADGFDDLIFYGYPQWQVHLGGTGISPAPTFLMNFASGCSWDFATGLGDINHDGYNDMEVIDPGCDNLWGTMCIYLGHPWLNPNPAFTIQGRDLPLNLIGINSAVGLGDVNGDHIADFAIGAFNSNFDGFRGRCVILSGDTSLRAEVSEHRPELPHDVAVTIFPNPFNSNTTIALDLPLSVRRASIEIFNLLGQVVHRVDVAVTSSHVDYHYDGKSTNVPLSTGLYFVRVVAGNVQTTTKMMILR